MLTLARAQLDTLDEAVGLRFLEQLRLDMEAEHEALFEDQPLFVRRGMIAGGLAVASGYGFAEQASLTTFVSLQCDFSPDFHTHPAVAQALTTEGDEEERLEGVLALPETVWEQVEVYGSDLAWLDAQEPDQRTARIAFRACGLLPAIMQTHSDAQAWALFSQAEAAASACGIVWEEGISVFAAAQAVYGIHFDQPGGPAWTSHVFTQPLLPADSLVGLLRYRIALDFGCLV